MNTVKTLLVSVFVLFLFAACNEQSHSQNEGQTTDQKMVQKVNKDDQAQQKDVQVKADEVKQDDQKDVQDEQDTKQKDDQGSDKTES